MLHKDPKDSSCECREAQGHADKGLPQGVLIGQESHGLLEAGGVLSVGVLMIGTLHTLVHVWREMQSSSVLVSIVSIHKPTQHSAVDTLSQTVL